MNRGDEVKVRVYSNQLLERIVWDEYNTYVLVCRPEVYSNAMLLGMDPDPVMGFPKEDVFLLYDIVNPS